MFSVNLVNESRWYYMIEWTNLSFPLIRILISRRMLACIRPRTTWYFCKKKWPFHAFFCWYTKILLITISNVSANIYQQLRTIRLFFSRSTMIYSRTDAILCCFRLIYAVKLLLADRFISIRQFRQIYLNTEKRKCKLR